MYLGQLQPKEPGIEGSAGFVPQPVPMGRMGGNGDFGAGSTCQAADKPR